MWEERSDLSVLALVSSCCIDSSPTSAIVSVFLIQCFSDHNDVANPIAFDRSVTQAITRAVPFLV